MKQLRDYYKQGVYISRSDLTENATGSNIIFFPLVQDFSYDVPFLETPVLDITQSAISSSETEDINISMSWLGSSGIHEDILGINSGDIFGNFSLKHLEKKFHDLYLLCNENSEASNNPSETSTVISFGDCAINSFGFSVSADSQLIVYNASFNALRSIVQTGISGFIPSLTDDAPKSLIYNLVGATKTVQNKVSTSRNLAIRIFPENESLNFEGVYFNSMSVSLDLGRFPIYKMGKKYPIHRLFNNIIPISLSLAFTEPYEGYYDTFLKSCDNTFDIAIDIKEKCSEFVLLRYFFKKLRINNISSSSSLFAKKNVTIDFVGELAQNGENTSAFHIFNQNQTSQLISTTSGNFDESFDFTSYTSSEIFL